MPLTLEQYATWLDGRDLPWPAPPKPEPVRARPHPAPLPRLKAVLWNVYGTLLAIPFGELLFEHPQVFVMSMALEKTIAEFKMWGSMSRKPGAPSDYMGHLYKTQLDELRMASRPDEKYPEIAAEKIWEGILKKLQQKEYRYDVGFYGPMGDYCKKIAYFFHASMQGTACYPSAERALQAVASTGLMQGLCGDGQCFTPVQLQRGLDHAGGSARLEDLIPPAFQVLSWEVRGKKPSEKLLREALGRFASKGISPGEVLHVGSRIDRDIAPARKLGMKTALFAGDRASLAATPEQLKDPALRPDVMMTELHQIADVVGG